jgi:hypothetical protein
MGAGEVTQAGVTAAGAASDCRAILATAGHFTIYGGVPETPMKRMLPADATALPFFPVGGGSGRGAGGMAAGAVPAEGFGSPRGGAPIGGAA